MKILAKLRVRRAVCSAVLLLSALWVGSTVLSQTTASKIVLFAVWPAQKGTDPGEPLIDPIAILSGSHFEDPDVLLDDKHDTEFEQFQKHYYRAGAKYPFFIGGGGEGAVTVKEAVGITCESNVATVVLPQPLAPLHLALASNSAPGWASHANARRDASPQQRAQFVALALGFLQSKGLSGISESAVHVDRLEVTDLGPGEKDDLVGNVAVKSKTKLRNIFLVGTLGSGRYTVALSSYHVSTDLEDGTDDVEEQLVDQIDLDGDRIDEIVTMSSYYESWDYIIYKEKNGAWQKIYHGGGGGC
jgi:hypothetical protein